ncbi:B12-binding domain-containing radical SAM protein [Streptomyces sp. NPDC046915]|uniref:B12-binding domain-containing radical SAM protein n=1 Tax=Streptomyces sp. NPDC046915 TaxID=3155257 RepID=UPI0033D7BB1D
MNPGTPVHAERLRMDRALRIKRELYTYEQGWRLYPGDGGLPEQVSQTALARETALEDRAARQRAESADGAPTAADLKYFPVLFVSAPHIEDGVTGAFPGMPTPLLYATCLLDRLVRIDEFPGPRVPRTVAVLNPATYNDAFERDLTEHLARHRPVVVGVSNLSEGHHYALRIARLVKRELPTAMVVFGGQHEDGVNSAAYLSAGDRVRAMPLRRRAAYTDFELETTPAARLADLETLSDPRDRACVDFVFAGDAPHALVEFFRVVAEAPDGAVDDVKDELRARRDTFVRLPGSGCVAFYDEETGRVERLPLSGTSIDGNELPFMDVRGLSHPNRFEIFGNRLTAQIMACLGCKYACAFCHESADAFLYAVSKFRQRTSEHVVHEMLLRREQGYEAFFFDDSTFTQNPVWLNEFLDRLKTAFAEPVEWGCQTTINDLDGPMLRRMADSGCTYVYFGVESAMPEPAQVHKVLQLGTTSAGTSWAARLQQVAGWCRDAGVRIGTSLQFGLGESPADRTNTLQMVADLHQDGLVPDSCVSLNINSPYPGTRQWVRMLGGDDPMPDYRERLVRHHAFETAHQFSSLRGQEVEAVYEEAIKILGPALHADGLDLATPITEGR